MLVALGILAFVVPGILVFVYLGLAAPVVEIEHRGVRAALARSYRLVRGHFWLVLAVLVPIEIVSDAMTDLATAARPRPARRLAGRRVADRHRDQHRADALLRGRRGAAHDRPDRGQGRRGPASTLDSAPLMITASIFSDFWNDQILADEKQGLFLVLVGFILSFAFIRMSTRLMRSPRVPWWPGSVVSDGGVHLHHLVFGIVTMMIAGTLGLAALGDSPYAEICAFFFGVGAGLTIDEFALWVYLDDVYWAEEGRASIDATVIAAAGMMLILLGFSPFSFDTSSVEQTIGSILAAAFVFAPGRDLLRQAAGPARHDRLLRLPDRDLRRRCGSASPARPGPAAATASATRRSRPRPRSASRPTATPSASRTPSATSIGGKPSEGVTAVTEEALATTREAVEEVRHRAERVTRPGGPAGGSEGVDDDLNRGRAPQAGADLPAGHKAGFLGSA